MSTKRYINTSIPYANAVPHIGFATELLYADVTARYWRQQGNDVKFVSGTDEHGQKIQRAAEQRNHTPQQYVDELSGKFRRLVEALHVSMDDFVRTTDERHVRGAQQLWTTMLDSGDVYKADYEGLYCVGCESFKTQKELVDGKCPNHLVEPELVKEQNYFFRLSAYADRLTQWFEQHEDFVIPRYRFNEIKEIVRGGLEDISISRETSKMSWGVAVPNDPQHVMYVWFEALMNYATAVGYGTDDEAFKQWWPSHVIIVGKDINRFHSVIFPAMLMAAHMDVPHMIAVHGFITVDGQKMSKSLGNVVSPFDLIEKYGVESVRYFFLREIPFDGDGDFSHTRLQERYAADLSNGLGNLLSRTTTMVEKYCDGKLEAVPKEEGYGTDAGLRYSEAMQRFEFHTALNEVWKIIGECDEYIEQQKPWQLAKTDERQLRIVLSHLLYSLQVIAGWLVPFLPHTAERMHAVLGAERITKAEPLFPRLEEIESHTLEQ